jgi:sirohydrochlorin ferrochelatase
VLIRRTDDGGPARSDASGPPVILAFRGSPYPDAARSAAELARAVALARPDTRVRSAFLDFGAPGLRAALAKEAGLGHRAAVVVPMLLTAGYHARVRIPAEITDATSAGLPLRVHLARVLGPTGERHEDEVRQRVARTLLRLAEEAAAAVSGRHSATPVWDRPNRPVDAIVLAAAGSRATRALDAVERVAAAMQAASAVPCAAAYLMGGRPDVAEAVDALRGHGARHVAVAAYLLTRGRRYAQAELSAWSAGTDIVAAPLAGAAELTDLVLHRVAAALTPGGTQSW